jgi:hydroxymethylpyrimidine/phosphomethylpyrimidine kinase
MSDFNFIPPQARYARVLSIAGSDSSGGAGIQADLKTISAHGCFGMTAITAITAQNTKGVRAIHTVHPDLVTKQIDAVVEDIGVDAVKIGMLHDVHVVRVVADALRRHQFPSVVLDPVMVASSGDRLVAPDTMALLVEQLFPLATLITPNLDEAAWLLDRQIHDVAAMDSAALDLQKMGARAVLLKGGHLPGPEVTDLLLPAHAAARRWQSPRIASRNTHGTGCTLASAIACQLALGHEMAEAIQLARSYVQQALARGATVRVGAGHGPLDHGFAPHASRHLPLRG